MGSRFRWGTGTDLSLYTYVVALVDWQYIQKRGFWGANPLSEKTEDTVFIESPQHNISKMYYIHLLNTELFMDFLCQLHLCLQAVTDLNNTIDILKLQPRWNGKINPEEQAHLGLPDNTVRYSTNGKCLNIIS